MTPLTRQLIDNTVQRCVHLVGLAGIAGLDLFGMVIVPCATLHETVRSICRGAHLTSALLGSRSPNVEYLSNIREAIIEACDMTKAECLAEIDATLVALASERQPARERVTDDEAKDMLSVDDLREMFKGDS